MFRFRKYKGILSVLLVGLLLFPSIVKLEHQHEHNHFICKAGNVKHLHTFHHSCGICNFEFSLSIDDHVETPTTKPEFSEQPVGIYSSRIFFDNTKFSFSLRGPPANMIA
jgi:hypothetical protein